MTTTMKRTQTNTLAAVDEHPLDSQAETVSTTTQTKGSSITSEELHRQIIEENAVRLWFHPCNQSIPLQRDGTVYTVVEGNLQNRKAVAELDEKQYQTLDLTDEEITYLHRYCYQHLIEYYGQGREIIHEPQSAPIDGHLEHISTLQQQLHYAQQIAIEEKEQHSLAEQENQQLRQERAELEELLDLDIDGLLDRSTVPPSDGETLLSPYAPERLNAKIIDLKGKYQQSPNLLLEEVEQIARSAWRSLDSQYHRDQDRRQRDEIRKGIQQVTELIPAEKDAFIGLVEENLTRYPSLDCEMSIAVGQFNRQHVGMADDTTISKKFKSLHKLGVLLDYIPGEIDKSNPERPVTTPARIRINPEMALTPSKIKKPDDDKPGGNRQSICKIPSCPASDPFSEAEHRTDKYSIEYCHLTDTVAIDSLPGLLSDSDYRSAINAVKEGRVFISEQLHRFAENADQKEIEAQKHHAFEGPATSHIYIDDIQTFETRLPYKQWCHMASDGPIKELHAMADALHLKREWFQDKEGHPHYDLTPSKRKQAIALGAIAVTAKELIQTCYPHTTTVMNNEKHHTFGQLYQIGYRSPEALDHINQALEQDPSLLVVDIRYTPESRNPNWTRAAFEKRFGNRYTWLRNLGNINHREKGDIRIANPEKGIEQLSEILKEHSAILLCGCPEYEECHRKTVADLFQRKHREHWAGILPLTIQASDETHCTDCKISIEKAEEFYFSEDGTPYCWEHGPQARPRIGQRVMTPAGLATVSNILFVEKLQQWRCSVLTDQVQADTSHFQVFNLSEVHVTQ